MTDNAVLRLRQTRLAASTRPYRARGCRAIRCQSCLLPQTNCLCASIEPQQAKSRFCLIMFDAEPLKPSNTGRLIADILPTTQAFLWSRTQVDPELLALLQNPAYQPYLVFPANYAQPPRPVYSQVPAESKTPLFVLLDGTWSEARKMFNKSPYLNHLPMFSPNLATTSAYQLREASRPEQHCTAEIAAALLELAGDQQAAEGLSAHFTTFTARYLAGKPYRPKPKVTAILAPSA